MVLLLLPILTYLRFAGFFCHLLQGIFLFLIFHPLGFHTENEGRLFLGQYLGKYTAL